MTINTICIVDDSMMARSITRQCLEISGLSDSEFIEASDGKIALDKIKEKNIDLIVTDLNMPNMDGNELITELKKEPKLKDIPVIVITSSSNNELNEMLITKGAFSVISKPVSPVKLYDVITKLNTED